ncbi:VOC family protein [Delftia acidovorans]|uniref:VOC family protein n=1 Tax=Delftia acidovorans TaxID=80866 RepID=UPI0030183683
MKLELDHLIVAAADLDSGARHVAELLGIAPQAGGAHARMGTHNRVMGLADGIYLEVIAVDPDAPAPAHARWFGLDEEAMRRRLARGPFLAHWAARVPDTADLSAWQAQHPLRIAPVLPMSRGDLRWRLTVPEDGSLPGWAGVAGGGVVPPLIQWDVPHHPGRSLPRQPLRLRSLKGHHAQAPLLAQGLQWLGADGLMALDTLADDAGTPWLEAEMETAQGLRILR